MDPPTDNAEQLKLVDSNYYKIYDVREECYLRDYIVKEGITLRRNLDLGYCFYEFTKAELIPYSKQVILMEKVN